MKVEIYRGVVCLEVGWLVEEAAVLTKENYSKLRLRNQIRVIRRGCYGTPALVEWESLPERYRKVVVKEWGNPEEQASRRQKAPEAWSVEGLLDSGIEAEEFFSQYTFDNGSYLPPKKRKEYVMNARLLEAVHKAVARMTAKRKSLGARTTGIWEIISKEVNGLNTEEHPHTLPANHRRLKERVATYRKEGNETLIHKNYRNQSATKVSDDLKESVLIELIGHRNNFDAEQVARIYNEMGKEMNWQAITASTVRRWSDKLELVTFAGARGVREFKSNKTVQVRRVAPTAPLYYWTMDGWDAELLYQRVSTDKDGKRRTTYHNRLTIVVILDPCMKYPIGYAIGEAESPTLIRQAVRNAINHTQELFGERHRPHQLQSDHYGRGKLTPMYEEVARIYTPAEVGNAKAKIVEPYFLYLNKTYCQFMPNWSGFGMGARKEHQPNADTLNKVKKTAVPEREGAVVQLGWIIEKEREKKRERYLELWSGIPQEKRLPMSTESYLYLFGEKTEANRMVGGGLQPKVLGERTRFECFDLKFHQESAAERWRVHFDPDDQSVGVAINEDETKRYLVRQPHVQPMALMDRVDGDAEKLKELFAFNDTMIESVTEQRAKAHELASAAMEEYPQLNDTLAKLLLTDSRGQHKDRRSEGMGKRIDTKPEPKAIAENVEFEMVEEYAPVLTQQNLREQLMSDMDLSEYE